MAEIATRSGESIEINCDSANWTSSVMSGAAIVRSTSSRFSYYSGAPPALYADGVSYPCSLELAKLVCQVDQIAASNLDSVLANEGAELLITELLGRNSLQFA